MLILGGGIGWLEHRVGDLKVVVSMHVLSINANFLTGALSDMKDKHWHMFHNGIYLRKKIK